METYKLILLIYFTTALGTSFYFKGKKEGWNFIADLSFLPFAPVCIFLLLIYQGLKEIAGYLEIKTIWRWYVLGKKDFFKESNNETLHYSKEQVLVFINLRTQQLLNSKNLIKRIKGNIRNHFVQKINKQENFVTRADNDYRMFLRGGDINQTPETPFNGIIHCCGCRFDVNDK